MSTDVWSQHSWDWASKEQREFYETIALHFDFAIRGDAVPTFLKALRENWFGQWPVIPELVEQGQLPADALSEGFELSTKQIQLVEAVESRRFKRVQLTLVWHQKIRLQKKHNMCLIDGPRPPPGLLWPQLPRWP